MNMKFFGPILLIILSGCSSTPTKTEGEAKGELKFLLDYNGKLPSEVGFMSNHIVERRLANLLKEKFEPFQKTEGLCEMPIVVIDNVATAHFVVCTDTTTFVRNISFDAEQDAVWIAEKKGEGASIVADHPKLNMPQELLRFKNLPIAP